MSTEETQQDQTVTEENQQVSTETTLEQDIETNLKDSEAPESIEVEVTDEEIEAELKASVKDALEPPQKWDRRYKEVFNEWGQLEKGREYQEAMLDWYKEQQGYATQLEQERAHWRKFAEPLQGAIEPFQQFITQSGATPDQMVRQALALTMRLSQNPRETLLGLAQRAGIDLSQIGQDAPYVDPQVQTLEQQIRRMQQESRQREQRQAEEHMHRIQAETEQQLRTFTEAKDDNGNPKHPHVQLVQGEMAQLIHGREQQRKYDSSLPAMTLEEAYQRACKLSDEVSQAEAKQQEAREAARKAAIAKKEAQAAKRVQGKPGVEAPSAESLEETIRKEWRKSQAA